MINSKQVTDTILMVRPVDFSFNEETAIDNEFQNIPDDSTETINHKAMDEFSEMVNILKNEGINVLVLEKSIDSKTPDAVFPNNWISTEYDGTLITYPMTAINRRTEKLEINNAKNLLEKDGFIITNVLNIGNPDEEELFLEGTGSMIIDHENRIIYMAESIRSNPIQLDNFTQLRNYKSVVFKAKSSNEKPVYHTNVIMSIACDFAVVCSECVYIPEERDNLLRNLKSSHEVIEISMEQMEKSFCGNILQVKSTNGDLITVMSDSAYNGFTTKQLNIIRKYGKIISVNIETIEKVGGGSARCMMAEIFLPKQ